MTHFLVPNFICIATLLLILAQELQMADGSTQQRKLEKQIIDNIFSSTNYDPRIRPAGQNAAGHLDVYINMHLAKIHRIEDEKMLFSLEAWFRQTWIDARLKFSTTNGISYINLNNDDELWIPSVFFNEYKATVHDVTTPNVLVRIFSNGTVLHSQRYNLLLYCDMDFRYYPFDAQLCNMTLSTYAHNSEEVQLHWSRPQEKAISISSTLINGGLYRLNKFYANKECIIQGYSELSLTFDFHRETRYYGLQVYIPATMLVIAAYLSFWIRMRHFTARIILSVATCYTLAMHLDDINAEVPKTSYPKAIDEWMGICMTFCFAPVVETIVVYVMTQMRTEQLAQDAAVAPNKGDNFTSKLQAWLNKCSDNVVDAIAKILYPTLFLFFVIVYCSLYLL